RPIRLDLHADSIALRREGPRERVAAENWRAAGGLLKTPDHLLAWERRLERPTVRRLHGQREDGPRLPIHRRHPERPASGGEPMRSCCRHEPRVTAPRGNRLALQ